MEHVALLISDLDGTLLGDNVSLTKFTMSYARVKDRLRLVYSSGRFLASIQQSIITHKLPNPDAIICGVGTEIHDVGSGKRIDGWPELRGGWDPERVMATCLAHPRLQPQPAALMSEHKISFYARDLDKAVLDLLLQQLSAAGQNVSLIYSSNRDLDILPGGIHKGSAAAFLSRHWRVERNRTIVAGDSGNDLAMFHQGFPGIVVGNAQPELRSFAGKDAYQATHHFAAGVMEGLEHWLTDVWIPPRLNIRVSAC